VDLVDSARHAVIGSANVDVAGEQTGAGPAADVSDRSWFRVLIVVEIFNLLSAVAGGIALVSSNGLGMPSSLLDPSPFDSFTGPGLILALVVGGTHAAALVLAALNRPVALAAAAAAAFGMIIWIYVEVSLLLFYHWLQTVYFASGIAQLVLVLMLLGVCPGRPRRSAGHRAFGRTTNGTTRPCASR
jgi:hypothetical protein